LFSLRSAPTIGIIWSVARAHAALSELVKAVIDAAGACKQAAAAASQQLLSDACSSLWLPCASAYVEIAARAAEAVSTSLRFMIVSIPFNVS
jgi:hypothetical protein